MMSLFNDNVDSGTVEAPEFIKLDSLTARRIARECVELWHSQSPDLSSPYAISSERRSLAKCATQENMELIDIDDAPKRYRYDSDEDYAQDAWDYATRLHKARAMCSGCPLLAECRAASMMDKKFLRKSFSVDNASPEKFGVWGGLTPEDRKRVFPYVVQNAEKIEEAMSCEPERRDAFSH